uniref:Sm protein B n=1 Tax=Meloidogyne hapla TaxID=6305 RepID=A0A1I8BU50_MELHA
MMQHINYKMKVIVQDNRTFIGYFKAFDKHMNIILSDCEELRRVKTKTGGRKPVNEEEKRILGLVLLRGDKIISISVEGPPAREDGGAQMPRAGGVGGAGQAKSAGRGVPMGGGMMGMPPSGPGMPSVPHGLQGPVRGMGGPGMSQMQPGYNMMDGPPRF